MGELKSGRRAAVRALLAALAAATAPRPHAQPAQAATALPPVVLWTAQRVFVIAAPVPGARQPRGAHAALAPAPHDAPGPAVSAHGIWLASDEPALTFWPVADDGTTGDAPASRHALPGPVGQLACSNDGRWAFAAIDRQLHLIDRDGSDSLVHDGTSLDRRASGRVRSLQALPHRRSVLVDWDRVGEWWEVSLDPAAPPVFDGLVHDYRMGEAIARPGYRHPRRIRLGEDGRPAPRLVAVPPGQAWAIGLDRGELGIVHLDIRRTVFRTPVGDAPAPWPVLASPHTGEAAQLWLAAGGRLLAFTPSRWGPPVVHPLPDVLRSLALSPRGDALWALTGLAGQARLMERPVAAGPALPWRAVDAAPPGIVHLVCAGARAVAALAAAEAGGDGADIGVVWLGPDGQAVQRRRVSTGAPVLGASLIGR